MQPGPAKSCPSCGERYDADVLFCPRDGTPLQSSRKMASFSGAEGDPYVGLELAGQIRIQHLIGIGSMGRVYRAFQGGIDRDVAVKILHRELSGNPELVGRFHREAKIASRLVHPNVVQVLMSGGIPRGGDPRVGGELFLAMEYLDGISLLSALAVAGNASEESALPLPRALHIVLQVCDAVGEAHAQGIVHRDLKPENIMLVRRGEDPDFVKVLDFGIARMDWADKSSVSTQAGLIFGTAKYISPEGAEGQPVGPPADVYSIATMLYQCLAGRAPFEGDSPVALLVQHTHAPPPDLRSIARSSYVPAPIAQVVMQNLSKRAGERARDARALGRDLALAARESGLDPDELVPHAGHARSGQVVKLASKARTRALELSPELAARIGGVAAPTSTPEGAAASSQPGHALGAAAGPASGRFPVEEAGGAGDRASWTGPISRREIAAAEAQRASHPSLPDATQATPLPYRAPHPSRPEATPLPLPYRASQPSYPDATPLPISSRLRSSPEFAPAPDLDFDEGPRAPAPPRRDTLVMEEAVLDPALPAPSTMQGIASEAAPRPRRAKIARLTAIAACAAAAVGLVAVLGGQKLGSFGASGDESVEAQVDRARDCMRRHAWEAPAGENVKEIAERASARWPADARVAELRQEAAERAVADALGRRYAGDAAGAIRLARLALELSPSFTTAQHLVAELGATPVPAPAGEAGVAPASAGSEGRGASGGGARGATPGGGSRAAPASTPGGAGSAADPRRGGADARPGEAKAPAGGPGAQPAPTPSASTPATGHGPVLPPSPPPLPEQAPSPSPSPSPTGTGPWL